MPPKGPQRVVEGEEDMDIPGGVHQVRVDHKYEGDDPYSH
jgi:hypothetical protein